MLDEDVTALRRMGDLRGVGDVQITVGGPHHVVLEDVSAQGPTDRDVVHLQVAARGGRMPDGIARAEGPADVCLRHAVVAGKGQVLGRLDLARGGQVQVARARLNLPGRAREDQVPFELHGAADLGEIPVSRCTAHAQLLQDQQARVAGQELGGTVLDVGGVVYGVGVIARCQVQAANAKGARRVEGQGRILGEKATAHQAVPRHNALVQLVGPEPDHRLALGKLAKGKGCHLRIWRDGVLRGDDPR